MANKIIKAQMKQRRDTKANWAAQNPVLLAGELGIVSDDPNLYKVGDGTTAWNALPFRGFDGTIAQETGTSENAVMSQKAVTHELTKVAEKITDAESDDYLEVLTDSEGRIIEAVRPDGTRVFFGGIENGYTETVEDRPDYLDVLTDSEGRIIEAVRPDGTKVIPKLETPVLDQISNILYGKKYVAIGDSFTEGSYSGDDVSKHLFTEGLYKGKNRVYPYYIGNRNKMEVVNMAVSGSCITTIADYVDEWPSVSFSYQMYKNIPTDADYITIKLGSNDATYLNQGRISIGTIDSEDVTTFYGAWNVVLMHIIDTCPNAKIGFIITGHLTEELYEAEKAIARKYGLRTLDFASEDTPYFFRQDLRKDVSAVVRQKRLEYYRVSEANIHPNDECQEFASTIIENFLRSL